MNQASRKSFSYWDLRTENIEPEEQFFADLDSLRIQFKNETNLNKYIPYTRQLAGLDENCMRIASNFLKQVSIMEKEYRSLPNNQGVLDTYTFCAHLRKVLDDPYNNVSTRLNNLAASFPPKGRDGPSLVKWYKETYHISTTEAQIQAIRNFFSGAYCWQFITVTDQAILDSCGSLLCLSMAVDYAGSGDDPQCGEAKNYLVAANDGIRSLMGGHMRKTYDDLIKDCAFIRFKDFVLSETSSDEHLKNGSKANTSHTLRSSRFMELRWRDAAMAPYYRVIIGCSSLDMGIECDVNGTPICTEKCGRIRRAIDSIIRYNEIVDILSDVKIKEYFNEVLIAFSIGGHRAIKGYADALSSVIEDVLDCDCEADGHQWAGSLVIGICSFYSLYPRYQVLCQIRLAARENASNEKYVEGQWEPFLPNVIMKCKLENNVLLHKQDWTPLWQVEDTSNEMMLSTNDDPRGSCSMCMFSAIALSGRILVESRSMAAKSHLPYIIYDLIGCSRKIDECRRYQCVPNDVDLYAAIWENICKQLYNYGCVKNAPEDEILASTSVIRKIVEHFCLAKWKPWDSDVSMPVIVDLFTSMDIVMRNTFNANVARDGIWRRKLLMGLVSSFMEFSAVRVYASICEYAFGKDVSKIEIDTEIS